MNQQMATLLQSSYIQRLRFITPIPKYNNGLNHVKKIVECSQILSQFLSPYYARINQSKMQNRLMHQKMMTNYSMHAVANQSGFVPHNMLMDKILSNWAHFFPGWGVYPHVQWFRNQSIVFYIKRSMPDFPAESLLPTYLRSTYQPWYIRIYRIDRNYKAGNEFNINQLIWLAEESKWSRIISRLEQNGQGTWCYHPNDGQYLYDRETKMIMLSYNKKKDQYITDLFTNPTIMKRYQKSIKGKNCFELLSWNDKTFDQFISSC